MADKPISGLTPVDRVKAADLFVLEQDGQARSVSGQTWVNWLVGYADGHGGVQSVAKTGTSGLVDTYTVTLSDGTTYPFYITNGAKGEQGDQTHVYIRWSAVPNPSDNDLSDKPEAYIGICATTAETAPTTASAYAPWYRYKGEQGDTGAPATLVSKSIQYMAADSGDVIPSGSWLDSIPVVDKGRYLWTRTTLIFNTGEPVVSYSVGRMGLDGDGSVNSVNGLTGDVVLRANNIKLQDSDFSVQTALDGKANTTDVLTLEEIEASTDLTGKIASAQALKDAKTEYAPTTLTGYTVSGTYAPGYGYLIPIPFPNANLFDIKITNINAFGVSYDSFNENSVVRIQPNKTNCFLLQTVNKADGGIAALKSVEYEFKLTKKV